MRKLGKDGGGQIYGKSHPEITAVLKHDVIHFAAEEWIHGKGPDAGQMLSAMVLAYGRLCLKQRRRLMRVLVGELEAWLAEGPEPARGEMVRRCVEAIQPPEGDDGKGGEVPSVAPTGPLTVGGHGVGGPGHLSRKGGVKAVEGGTNRRHRGARRRAGGQEVRAKPQG